MPDDIPSEVAAELAAMFVQFVPKSPSDKVYSPRNFGYDDDTRISDDDLIDIRAWAVFWYVVGKRTAGALERRLKRTDVLIKQLRDTMGRAERLLQALDHKPGLAAIRAERAGDPPGAVFIQALDFLQHPLDAQVAALRALQSDILTKLEANRGILEGELKSRAALVLGRPAKPHETRPTVPDGRGNRLSLPNAAFASEIEQLSKTYGFSREDACLYVAGRACRAWMSTDTPLTGREFRELWGRSVRRVTNEQDRIEALAVRFTKAIARGHKRQSHR